MFDPASRYYNRETATHIAPDGREIAYVRRRFLPRGRDLQLLVEVEVTDGDRLDLIAARTLGAPDQFWRIADANDAMNPPALTEETGRILRVPIPRIEP